jgi:hypothetical protein
LLFTVTSTTGLYYPHSLRKSGLKLVGNVNIVYRNLKYENSKDYAQKPQRNCKFMNSASGHRFKNDVNDFSSFSDICFFYGHSLVSLNMSTGGRHLQAWKKHTYLHLHALKLLSWKHGLDFWRASLLIYCCVIKVSQIILKWRIMHLQKIQ